MTSDARRIRPLQHVTAAGTALAVAVGPLVLGALLVRSAGGDPMASVNALIAGGGQRARISRAQLRSGARLRSAGGRRIPGVRLRAVRLRPGTRPHPEARPYPGAQPRTGLPSRPRLRPRPGFLPQRSAGAGAASGISTRPGLPAYRPSAGRRAAVVPVPRWMVTVTEPLRRSSQARP
ncbi:MULTISPECIES: hypothetical protein [unclassified Streptomyces]|uniref:hypothetical protein n=1 Tax=unclassified Streptomyces TaxID=2593676 RepID=UPI0007C8A163|nr:MULTISPECIES: hypothetical protein [unclassified Streptomyces]